MFFRAVGLDISIWVVFVALPVVFVFRTLKFHFESWDQQVRRHRLEWLIFKNG
jgi:hypothetical protein